MYTYIAGSTDTEYRIPVNEIHRSNLNCKLKRELLKESLERGTTGGAQCFTSGWRVLNYYSSLAQSRRWFPRTVGRRVLRPADQHFNFNGSTPSQRSIIPSARADGLPP